MGSVAFAPYIFLSLGKQLANGKLAFITSLPETEYDGRQRRPSPAAGRAESSFHPSQESREPDQS